MTLLKSDFEMTGSGGGGGSKGYCFNGKISQSRGVVQGGRAWSDFEMTGSGGEEWFKGVVVQSKDFSVMGSVLPREKFLEKVLKQY